MTKQQQFASKLRLSKLCRWILTLGAFKLAVLVALILMPPADMPATQSDSDTRLQAASSVAQKAGGPAASATRQDAPDMGRSLTTIISDSLGVRGQLAHAAETSEGVPITPPAPKIRPNQSPFSQDPAPAGGTSRPDQVVPGVAPAPNVSPFVPRDSAQRKQEELNRREQELLALQQQMQNRLDELKSLENKIQGMLKQANNVQDEKLKHLIDVYSNMKPKQAAEVLATLDERIAVKILAGMRGKMAGEILTYMQPEPAAKLSELLSRTQLPE